MPAITAEITVTQTAPLSLTFKEDTSARKGHVSLSEDGDLHFRKAKDCVRVTMKIVNSGYTFQKNPTLSYAPDPDGTYTDVPSGGNSQFSPIGRISDTQIAFTYQNADPGCGADRYSGYGIYIADASNNPLGMWDPIVTNGGNGINMCAVRHRPQHAYPRR